MDADGPSGFRNAPVTKFLVSVVGGCSAIAAIFNLKPQLALEFSSITSQGQFWRLFTSHWAFNSIGSTVVGTWLIYRLKIVERRYGSSKYAALVFITFVASTLLQAGVLITGPSFGLKSITSGPYALLFSLLYQFQKIVPASYQVSVLGINVSDKTYAYLAAVQLLLASSTSSIVPCLCGLAVGAMYNMTATLKQWRFPTWVRSFASKYILPVLAVDKKVKYQSHTLASSTSTTSHHSTTRQRAPTPIKDDDIETMFAMFPNYSRQDIKNALTKSKSDLNRAAEILLSSESSTSASGSQ